MIDIKKIKALAESIAEFHEWVTEEWAVEHFGSEREAQFVALCSPQSILAIIKASEAAQDDANRWHDLLASVIREIDDGEFNHEYRGPENAPSHAHDVPGIWNADNGEKGGTPCGWCATWNNARLALAQHQRDGS